MYFCLSILKKPSLRIQKEKISQILSSKQIHHKTFLRSRIFFFSRANLIAVGSRAKVTGERKPLFLIFTELR